MKYSPDIALQILKAIEAHPKDELRSLTKLVPEIDDREYHFHCRLMSEAGYISVYEVKKSGDGNHYWPRQLKWLGVKFLEQFRSESLWTRAKDEAVRRGAGMALDTLFEMGKRLVAID